LFLKHAREFPVGGGFFPIEQSHLGQDKRSGAGRGDWRLPYGFGLIHDGKVYGLNVNRLTKNTNRDPIGTAIHRFIPCRIEAAAKSSV
jgi:hypothetical protein